MKKPKLIFYFGIVIFLYVIGVSGLISWHNTKDAGEKIEVTISRIDRQERQVRRTGRRRTGTRTQFYYLESHKNAGIMAIIFATVMLVVQAFSMVKSKRN
ncbi:MAG: hypothetical protein E7262_00800 [Lachnospiraceae bacterium]|nr:hypothetical protein [Lachnospiraceae bacterium]